MTSSLGDFGWVLFFSLLLEFDCESYAAASFPEISYQSKLVIQDPSNLKTICYTSALQGNLSKLFRVEGWRFEAPVVFCFSAFLMNRGLQSSRNLIAKLLELRSIVRGWCDTQRPASFFFLVNSQTRKLVVLVGRRLRENLWSF